MRFTNPSEVALNPQPEPPAPEALQPAFTRVGEARLMDSSIASRLDKLTLTSKIAPWLIFPLCFYSKVEVCETTTDCDGYFNCCFNWWPFHFRPRPAALRLPTGHHCQGDAGHRRRADGDLPRSLHQHPLERTHAHIDLFLDDENVVCGPG